MKKNYKEVEKIQNDIVGSLQEMANRDQLLIGYLVEDFKKEMDSQSIYFDSETFEAKGRGKEGYILHDYLAEFCQEKGLKIYDDHGEFIIYVAVRELLKGLYQ